MRVRLNKKLAQALNGVDLRPYTVGEVIDLAEPLAKMLIAERWADEAVAVDCPSTAYDRTAPTKSTRRRSQSSRSRSRARASARRRRAKT